MQHLPKPILTLILGQIQFSARRVCRRWKQVIDQIFTFDQCDLHRIIRGSTASILRMFLSRTIVYSYTSGFGVIIACETKKKWAVRALAKYLPKNFNWDYALYTACVGGDMGIVREILKHRVDYSFGLSGACVGGHFEIYQFFRSFGVQPVSLYDACRGGNEKIIRDLGCEDWEEGFIGACEGGHIWILREFLPKIQPSEGFFLEAICAAICQYETVKFLLEIAGPIQLTECFRRACECGHESVCELMLRHDPFTRVLLSGPERKNANRHGVENLWPGFVAACVAGRENIVRLIVAQGRLSEFSLRLGANIAFQHQHYGIYRFLIEGW